MDQTQSELIEKYQESKLRKQFSVDDEHESESDDDLLEALEDEDMISKYREARIQELSNEFKSIDSEDAERNGNLGSVIPINDEKDLMEIVTKSELTLVHFYQPEFDKCKIMNSRLSVRISIYAFL